MNRQLSKFRIAVAMAGALAVDAGLAADDPAALRALVEAHCSQCHTLDKGQPHGQGPNLGGLLGRQAGSASGYPYSHGFKAALQGRIWDRDLLDRWLTDTMSVAPETQMIYFQDDPETRAALIRFFETQK